jgi:ribonuclease D
MMPLITATDTLAAVCARLATHPSITVDTEFLRETTFWPKLCVVQMASETEAVAVDALAPGLDLTPFFELMANPAVTKVFHAARQDIEIIWKMSGLIPSPLFDTQVAAMVCGFGDQVSYEQLAGNLAGARIDKSSRFTDWSKRPLSPAQVEYALADVTHLRVVYQKLAAKLAKSNRAHWLAEEMAVLGSVQTYEQKPENAWMRIKTRARKPRDLAVMIELAAWREREAQTRDVPRSRILKDEVLGEIALAAPTSAEALARLRALPNGFERSKAGAEVIACIERGLARDPKTLPELEAHRQLGNGAGAVVQLLKVLLQAVAEQHQVAAKMIATVDDLEAIATSDLAETPALVGWRRELFGEQALALKAGRLSLAIQKGRVVTRTLEPLPEPRA